MNYSHLLYKRGYLFSQTEVEPPVSTWTKRVLNGTCFFYSDPENSWAFLQEKDNWVALSGKAIDIICWNMDIHAIVGKCLDSLCYSEEKMLDYIDHLSGRFILIYHHGNNTKFMTDAFGTRSAFYSLKNSALVASHSKILSDCLNLSECKQMANIRRDRRWRIPWAHANPGILTQYEDVNILTPNTLLNIEERKIQRFYPRTKLTVGNLSDVIEEVSVILKRQLELLNTEYNLALSLSAGIDSRTTLSAARDIAGNMFAFTYEQPIDYDNLINEALNMGDIKLAGSITRIKESRQKVMETDLLVAREMTEALELRHVCLVDVLAQHGDFQDFNEVLDCNTYHSHARRLAKAYLEQIRPNALHIRSNVSDIGKAFYRKKGFNELPLTAERMAQAWKRMEDNKLVVEAFAEFTRVAQFGEMMNYDPFDMFFWEHREGTWLTCVLLESDVAFDTFELFNCRALAEKMLSVPVEQRKESAIHYGIIKRLWPVLLQWPINAPPFRLQLEELRTEYNWLKAEIQKETKAFTENPDTVLRRTKYEPSADALPKALAEQDRLINQLRTVKNSFSYRLGTMLVQAVQKPGRNIVLLPYHLICLCITELKKRKIM